MNPRGLLRFLRPATPAPERPRIGVGLFLLDGRDRFLLLRRRGSHGAGCWGLVGGHLEYGQTPQQAAVAETSEEAGVALDPGSVALGPYTNDVFPVEGRHYVTLFASARLPAGQVPRIMEPHKADAMDWFGFDRLPDPLFVPLRNFLAQGNRPPFA